LDRKDDDSDAESEQKDPLVEGTISKEKRQEERKQRTQGQNQQRKENEKLDDGASRAVDDLEVRTKKQQEQLKQEDARIAREEAGRSNSKWLS
jgi:hypothetical protein